MPPPYSRGKGMSDQGSLISSTVQPQPSAPTRSQGNYEAREQMKPRTLSLSSARRVSSIKAEAELQAALDHLESIGQEESNDEHHPLT
eukprot:1669356-Amphidinium_carterae.3